MNETPKNHFLKPLFLSVLIVVCLAGVSCMPCKANNTCPIENPVVLPVETSSAVQPEPVDHEGSLWRQGSHWDNLFNNIKARNAGDVVTIQIVESSKATNKATTETDRSSSLTAGIKKLFGAENEYTATDPFFNPFGEIKGGMTSSFEGDGVTERSGNLSAHITAKVTEVLPNGNLKIKGAREVRINHETQFIYLTGVVRPRDISSDNVVMSTYIADARIEYSGTGVINDRQRPGWLANILNVIWPF